MSAETSEFYDPYMNRWFCEFSHTHCIVASVDGEKRYCYGFSMERATAEAMFGDEHGWCQLGWMVEKATEDMAERCGLDPGEVVWTGRGLREHTQAERLNPHRLVGT